MTGSERVTLRLLERSAEPQLQQMVRAIIHSREQLQMVLDSLHLGILVLGPNYHVISINREAHRLLPLQSSPFRERLVWELVADPNLAAFLQQRLPDGLVLGPQELLTNTGGRQQILSFKVGSLVKAHHLEGFILMVEDVTDKKYAELQLLRAEKLASFTTAAAGMAHDIRNPLEAISIHLQLIQKNLRQQEEQSPAQLLSFTEIISDEVQRLNQTVGDFLALTHQSAVPQVDVDLNQLLKKVLALLRPEFERCGTKVELDLATDLPLIKAEPQSLQHALINLLKNAFQATPAEGSISLASNYDQQQVRLFLQDNGPGIDPQHLERIFEPYYTTKKNGSGLGLARVFNIVREHQGKIDIRNRPGGGCLVELRLPRSQASYPKIEEKPLA